MLTPVHIQNTDIRLDQGGQNEVSAQEIRSFLDNNTLDSLLDVDAPAPLEGQLLAYVGGSVDAWRPINPSSFGGYGTADFLTDFATRTTSDLSEGTNLYYTSERVDDRVASLLVAGTNITLDYDDGAGTLTINSSGGSGATSLDDLTDVFVASPEDGQVLTYVGGSVDAWVAQSLPADAVGITSLNGLTNTVQSFTIGSIDTNVQLSINSLVASHIFDVSWSGTLGVVRGGTGASTSQAAMNNLSPLTQTGDIIYREGSGATTRLAIGSDGDYLESDSGVPVWSSFSTSWSNQFNAASIFGLSDVVVGLPAQGFTLVLNGSQDFVLTAFTLENLTDTSFSPVALSGGEVLKFNGSVWIAGSVVWSEIGSKPTEFTPESHTHPLSDLEDGTATDGDVVMFTGGSINEWQASAVALDNLSDVVLNDNPIDNSVLIFDSASGKWQDAELTSGDLPNTVMYTNVGQTVGGDKIFEHNTLFVQSSSGGVHVIRSESTSTHAASLPNTTGIIVLAESNPPGDDSYILISDSVFPKGEWRRLELDRFLDVDINNPDDYDVLVYSAGSEDYWSNEPLSSLPLIVSDPEASTKNVINNTDGSQVTLLTLRAGNSGTYNLFSIDDSSSNSVFSVDSAGNIRTEGSTITFFNSTFGQILATNAAGGVRTATFPNHDGVVVLASGSQLIGGEKVFGNQVLGVGASVSQGWRFTTSQVSERLLTIPTATFSSTMVIAESVTTTPSKVALSTSTAGQIQFRDLIGSDMKNIVIDDLLDVIAPNPSDGDVLRYVGGSLNYWSSAPLPRFTESATINSPSSSEDVTMFFTTQDLSVTQITAVVRGSSPSVTWTIRHSGDRSATGSELVVGGTTTTNQADGSVVDSLSESFIPAHSYVWLETTAQTGTVDELNVTLEYSVD